MPAPAPASKEWLMSFRSLQRALLTGDPVSQFEYASAKALAKKLKKSAPAESLQLEAVIALLENDEKGGYSLFKRAIVASTLPNGIRVNYAGTLVYYGDFEEAEKVLRDILKKKEGLDPEVLSIALQACNIMGNFDLGEKFIQLLAELYPEYKAVTPDLMIHYLHLVSEDKALEFLPYIENEIHPCPDSLLKKIEELCGGVDGNK